ncbi:hypothetical protein L228DRAFT_246157 [Xylona heveae TC161]|uniref:GYF domain-containing protein n=1 Tax=Xylona heveae (strain CBS 132557 / TC161) TaxID=1328760 RepID=A0A165HEG5_XYLHT|nr:hypothetical protein L228DRAFT_246157 [Xylona heveae TC161]KZF23389.1 hypothetical protein L228DRAFT_246157 [Xylona heveae TC161]
MPSPFTSSFASAAAINSNADGSSTRASLRGDGPGGGDWPRSRVNGATHTFRRPSVATNASSSSQRDSAQHQSSNTTSNPGIYVPPHIASGTSTSVNRTGNVSDSRYSKEQLLDLFKVQRDVGDISKNLSSLFIGGWEPGASAAATHTAWNRRDERNKDSTIGPEVCWDQNGSVEPMGLSNMTGEEKELFSTSVNSPLKPPPQNANKENIPGTTGANRKTSLSQNAMGTFNAASPGNARPSNRRRETSDSLNQSTPGGSGRALREESGAPTPPPSLLRRRTDLKDIGNSTGSDERDKSGPGRDNTVDSPNPFGTLKRSTTGPFNAGLNAPASPWSSAASQNATFSPMGAFGNFSLAAPAGQPPTPSEKRPGLGSLRGESRFKGLMGGESSEDLTSRVKERAAGSGSEKRNDTEADSASRRWGDARSARPLSSDTDPFAEGEERSGSAALGGGQDVSPPPESRVPDLSAPNRQISSDDLGFAPFSMSSELPRIHDLLRQSGRDLPQDGSSGSEPLSGREPMSPTNTNPYQSPEVETADADDIDTDGSDIQNTHLPGLSALASDPTMGIFGPQPTRAVSGFEGPASDRSQTSSVGPNRGFPSLGGLGGLGGLGSTTGWPAGPGSVGTPSRERAGFTGAFGDPIFGGIGDLQSPSLASHNASGLFGPGTPSAIGSGGSVGRGSKLGSLFPASMQEQMRAESARQEEGPLDGSDRQPVGTLPGRPGFPGGSGAFGPISRDTGSPMRAGRGIFDDLLGNLDPSRGVRDAESSFSANDTLPGSFGHAQSAGSIQPPLPGGSNSALLSQTLAQAQGNAARAGQVKIPSTGSAGSQIPATQQRTMVMPDRMRWIYKDPQGNTQGPWSGLEMHDWYKAGFFSPELLVKKYEDPDYEPLAQLIRRIGNSREPFLVPQIGIPHGPPSAPPSSQWTGAGPPPATGVSGTVAGAQPPFASSFPSFGTTLTAEQQNALERRKQEEQYLMARQKEHLAQQQVMMKQMHQIQGPIHPQQLHHHSSAHSLHSQPSFGSITSPPAYPPVSTQPSLQAPQGFPGVLEASLRQHVNAPYGSPGPIPDQLAGVRDDDLPALFERLNAGRGTHPPFGVIPGAFSQQQQDAIHAQQVAAMLNDRARLQREQAQHDLAQQTNDEQRGHSDRLQQFHELRTQHDEAQAAAGPEASSGKPSDLAALEGQDEISHQSEQDQSFAESQEEQHLGQHQQQEPRHASPAPRDASQEIEATIIDSISSPTAEPRVLTLTEQVQKAASAKQTPTAQAQSPWGKVDTGMPYPFPPPQSVSPLPAPAAQRSRQNVAEALTASSRSRSQTPVETPTSIAPWAKEPAELPKGPSLKEIQEAEARKAAEQEEIASAARRALAQQERMNQPPAPAPGLPSTSTWASSSSPSAPAPASSWAKTTTGKTAPGAASTGAKKTLQQIQKEEEARKQKAAAVASAASAANAAGTQSSAAAGKRYADLASKVAAPQASASAGGAWTTVGANGKVKSAPAPPATGSTGGVKISSTAQTPTLNTAVRSKLVSTPSKSGVAVPTTSTVNAAEEFTKWAKAALAKGLHSNINVDDFVQQLLTFPLEAEIISECVYANSSTMDGNRFADEYIRRRKLAEKGIVDTSGSFSPVGSDSKASGGWSEVAKKNPVNGSKDESTAAFKVVAPKKKGSKR